MKRNQVVCGNGDDKEETDGSEMQNNYRIPLIILIAGITLVAIAPYLFTRDWGAYALANNSGNIGDTIGGITAPITSIIGSILVFYALKTQIDANRQIQLQFKVQVKMEQYLRSVQYISKQIDNVGEEIQRFEYSKSENTKNHVDGRNIPKNVVYTGTTAIEILIADSMGSSTGTDPLDYVLDRSAVQQFLSLTKICRSLIERIELGKFQDLEKEFFLQTIWFLILSKILPAFEINLKRHQEKRLPTQLQEEYEYFATLVSNKYP